MEIKENRTDNIVFLIRVILKSDDYNKNCFNFFINPEIFTLYNPRSEGVLMTKFLFPLYNYNFVKIRKHLLKLPVTEQRKYYAFITEKVEWDNAEINVELFKIVYPNEFNKYCLHNYEFDIIKTQMNSYDTYDNLCKYYNYVIKECKIEEASERNPFSSNKYSAIIKQIVTEFNYIRETKFERQILKAKKESEETKKANEENKKVIEVKRFMWNGTEESILRFFYILNKCGFVTDSSYNSRFINIENAFINKSKKPFKHKQLSVTESKHDMKSKINKNDEDYITFENLINELKKILPD